MKAKTRCLKDLLKKIERLLPNGDKQDLKLETRAIQSQIFLFLLSDATD